MYHRILPAGYKSEVPVQPGMWVSGSSFEMHLDFLDANFSIISLGEMIRKVSSDEDLAGCCVITFDDGWVDNYQFAYPLLRKKQIPATIFLATDLISTDKWFWPEEVAWCLSCAIDREYAISSLALGLDGVVPHFTGSLSREETHAVIDETITRIKKLSPIERGSIYATCSKFRQKEQGKSTRFMLNWAEVHEMKKSGLITFGSHTASHCLLDQLTSKEIRLELEKSFTALGTNGDKFFAYPNGNYNDEVLKEIKNAGVTAALTTERGRLTSAEKLLRLPRIGLHNDISNTLPLLKWRLFVQ
jgi:peptidoglycan/xylan/chitin deacetylase (PgdA/CDA1 family)